MACDLALLREWDRNVETMAGIYCPGKGKLTGAIEVKMKL